MKGIYVLGRDLKDWKREKLARTHKNLASNRCMMMTCQEEQLTTQGSGAHFMSAGSRSSERPRRLRYFGAVIPD